MASARAAARHMTMMGAKVSYDTDCIVQSHKVGTAMMEYPDDT